MRRFVKMLAVILFLSAAVGPSAQAKPGRPDFPYCTELTGVTKQGGLAALRLDAEILEKCSPGCVDLRLIDSQGIEVPYVLLENSRPAEPQAKYALEMIEYRETPGRAVVTARLPERHRPVSVIEVNTPDRDFKKRVLLESGRDGRTWRVVSRDVLYDFSSRVNLRKTRLEFPRTGDRYFRLTFSDDGGAARPDQKMRLSYQGLDFSVEGMQEKKLTIKGVHGLTAPQRERIHVYDNRTFRDLKAETDKDGNTVIILDAGLPVEQIAIDVADAYYSRNITVSAMDKGTGERRLSRGAIHRFVLDGQKEEEATLAVRSRRSDSYRFVIENRRNPPLTIRAITLSWVEQDIYFLASAAPGPSRACFGNMTLERPEYDLARFITQKNLADHSPEFLRRGAIIVNSAYVPPRPKAEQERIQRLVLILIVLAVAGLLAYWIFRLVKKLDHEKRA